MKWLDCCKFCCYKCACAISGLLWVLQVSTSEQYGRVLGEFRFHCFEEPRYWFLQRLDQFTFPPAASKASLPLHPHQHPLFMFSMVVFLLLRDRTSAQFEFLGWLKMLNTFYIFLFIYITILRQRLSVPRRMASNSQGSAAHVSCALLWLKVCTTTPEILKHFIVLFLFFCLWRTISLACCLTLRIWGFSSRVLFYSRNPPSVRCVASTASPTHGQSFHSINCFSYYQKSCYLLTVTADGQPSYNCSRRAKNFICL